MNDIVLRNGAKLVVTEQSINNGYVWDVEKAKKLLQVGGVYTVDTGWEHDLHVTVILKEFPGESFNGLTFENCIVEKTEYEKELWRSVNYRMREEGFDYCFDGYSNWEEIKDERFHQLRKNYLEAAANLRQYIIYKNEKNNPQL
jgi:hypothetical protein